MCPISGGNWNNSANAGVWNLNWNNGRGNSNDNIGFRSDSGLPRIAWQMVDSREHFSRTGCAKSAAISHTGRTLEGLRESI